MTDPSDLVTRREKLEYFYAELKRNKEERESLYGYGGSPLAIIKLRGLLEEADDMTRQVTLLLLEEHLGIEDKGYV